MANLRIHPGGWFKFSEDSLDAKAGETYQFIGLPTNWYAYFTFVGLKGLFKLSDLKGQPVYYNK